MMGHINNKTDKLGHQREARRLHKVHNIENVQEMMRLQRREETKEPIGMSGGLVIHEVVDVHGLLGLPMLSKISFDNGIAHL